MILYHKINDVNIRYYIIKKNNYDKVITCLNPQFINPFHYKKSDHMNWDFLWYIYLDYLVIIV